jgi:HAMP domain-containing protein
LWEKPIVGTQKEGSQNWYFQTTHQAFLEVKTTVTELSDLNSGVMFKTASELQNKANRAIMPGIVAIIAALVFSLLFSYFVNYYMISPIVRITERVKQFVDRKLPFDANIETTDELYELENSIRTLCDLANMPENKL